jgi:bzd-type benzoyl-CoA reductase N subunit
MERGSNSEARYPDPGVSEGKGLAAVEELYQDRRRRAKQLKEQGQKIIGYFCCYVPVEFLTALGLVPYRIMGSVKEPVTQADVYLETTMCPFIRSCFDLALKGDYDFLDGLVVPHSCDTIELMFNIWRHFKKPAYSHYINVPHMVQASSFKFFKKELEVFGNSLQRYTGKKLDDESLRQAIDIYNQNRAVLRELYELRKLAPPLISGAEVTKVIVVGMGIPAAEHTELVKKVILEVKQRPPAVERKPVRLLVQGAEIDNAAFIELVEDAGANVVMDDLCTGTRFFWEDVVPTPIPLDGLVDRYLGRIRCPRTYRPRTGSVKEDLDNRFGYLLEYAKDFDANGVIIDVLRFCDTHELALPDLRDYLQQAGVPVLLIEDDYSVTTTAQLRTRVQAFIEIVSNA